MKIAWLNRHNPHDHKLQPDRVLQQVRIASPCSADWERMSGDQRIRHCPECNLNVYNLSAMTAREAAQLVANREGRLCVHFYRRTDGTMLTQNCPRGLRVTIKRVSRIAGAAFSAVIGMTIMTLRATPLQGSSRLVQIDRNNSGIAVQVADPTGAVIVNAHVTVVNESTKSEITGATGSSGTLRLLHLAAGSYVIAVSSPGFRPYSEVVAVRERQVTNLNITLPVGATTGGLVEMSGTTGEITTVMTIDSVAIPLVSAPNVPEESVSKKPFLQKIFSGIRHKLKF